MLQFVSKIPQWEQITREMPPQPSRHKSRTPKIERLKGQFALRGAHRLQLVVTPNPPWRAFVLHATLLVAGLL
jgi:hypothetical protein